jgi:WD40 repeat protein
MFATCIRALLFSPVLATCLCIGQIVPMAKASEPPITSVAFTRDGRSAVACSQAGLHVYSWPGLDLQQKVKTTASNLHDLAFSPSGDWLAAAGGLPAEEGTVEIFSWEDRKSIRILSQHKDSVMSVAWLDDSTIASASLDHRIVLWNAQTGSAILQFDGHSRGVSSLCFLSDAKTLISAGIDQSLRVWNLDSGKLVRSLDHHTLPVSDIALRPGDKPLPMVASVGEDRTVRLWQPTIGRMVRSVKLSSIPLEVAWLSDGSRAVVSCADGHARLVDPDSAEVTRDIPVLDGWAYSLAVHPTDGSVLVGGSGGQLRRVFTGAAE